MGCWKGKALDIVKRVDLGAEKMGLHLDLSRFLDAEREGKGIGISLPIRFAPL